MYGSLTIVGKKHFINQETCTSCIYLWTTSNECVTSRPEMDIDAALDLLTCPLRGQKE